MRIKEGSREKIQGEKSGIKKNTEIAQHFEWLVKRSREKFKVEARENKIANSAKFISTA